MLAVTCLSYEKNHPYLTPPLQVTLSLPPMSLSFPLPRFKAGRVFHRVPTLLQLTMPGTTAALTQLFS